MRSAWYRGHSPPGDGEQALVSRWNWIEGYYEDFSHSFSSPPTGSSEPPTPHYNTWILQDIALESHVQLLSTVLGSALGLKDGVALLKVWLRQRELDKVSWK